MATRRDSTDRYASQEYGPGGKLRKRTKKGSRLIDEVVGEVHGMLTGDPTQTELDIARRDKRLKREGKPAYKSPLRKLMK